MSVDICFSLLFLGKKPFDLNMILQVSFLTKFERVFRNVKNWYTKILRH